MISANDYTGTGFITKGRTQITTWLYQALHENMPYDQMTRELIDAKEDAAALSMGSSGEAPSMPARPATCNSPRMYRRYFWGLI